MTSPAVQERRQVKTWGEPDIAASVESEPATVLGGRSRVQGQTPWSEARG